MAGIFSRGFGFPSTSLAAAAEATAKGSAGSRAGAGPRPSRRPPPAGKKKIPGSGSSEQSGERAFAMPGCGGGLVAALSWSHLDRCCSPVSRLFWEASSRALGAQGWLTVAILLLGPEAWMPILTCHCVSEVRRPLWKRSGGDARLPLREALL